MLNQGWRRALALAAALSILSDTAAAQKILQQKDQFSGTTDYFTEMREAKLEGGGSFLTGRFVNVRLEASQPPIEADRPYLIVIRTQTPSWVFISAGPSLILKLDGEEMMTLTGPGSSKARTVVSAEALSETALWPLTQAQLDRLARAKKVEFRILGDQQNLTGEWKPDTLKDVAYFATEAPKLLHPEALLVAQITDAAKAQAQQPCPTTARAPSLGPPVHLGVMGVSVSKPMADSLHLTAPQGVFVVRVMPGSAADAAGIKIGDILTRLADSDIVNQCGLLATLAGTPGGSTVPMTVLRNGTSWTTNVKLEADTQTAAAMPAAVAGAAAAPTVSAPVDSSKPTDIYSELTKLDELRRKGILTDAEFEAQKQKILNAK